MDIDDHALRALWQRQKPPSHLAREIAAKVERHRRRAGYQRAAEAAVTLAGVTLLVWPGNDGRWSPSQWLLVPFFAVFVAVGWTVVLGSVRRRTAAVDEPVSRYADARKAQLRDAIRHMRLAVTASAALLAYSTVALLAALWAGADAWREAATGAVAWAALWTAGTSLFARARRDAIRREYRQLAGLGRRG